MRCVSCLGRGLTPMRQEQASLTTASTRRKVYADNTPRAKDAEFETLVREPVGVDGGIKRPQRLPHLLVGRNQGPTLRSESSAEEDDDEDDVFENLRQVRSKVVHPPVVYRMASTQRWRHVVHNAFTATFTPTLRLTLSLRWRVCCRRKVRERWCGCSR